MKKSMIKVQRKNICKSFNLGTGRSIKIDFLFNLIKKILKNEPKLIRKKLEKYDLKKSTCSYRKINNFLNLNKSSFTTIEDGLVETIKYFRNS